jgi:peptidoglycan hydrolase CwlO-like protein
MSKNIINEYVRDFGDLIDVIQKIERKYNELHEELQNQDKIDELNEEIDELEDKLFDANETNTELRGDIAELKDEISRLEKLYDNALKEIETLKSEILTQ